MKNLLVPAFLGVCCLTVLPFAPAGAQMPFTSAPTVNSNPYGHSGFGQPATAAPQAAPATAVPAAGGYGMPGNGYPPASFSNEPIDPDHKLNRGDRLSYRVVEDHDDKIIPLIVTDSGEVEVPLINRVKAAGKTTQQLTSDIKSRLEQEYYYHATVVLGLDAVAQRASRGTVYVSGRGISQGSVELPPDAPLTVSQAVAKMGGIKEFGNGKAVKVIRKGNPLTTVNVDAVLKGEIDKDFTLQPGDTVVVPEKKFNISF